MNVAFERNCIIVGVLAVGSALAACSNSQPESSGSDGGGGIFSGSSGSGNDAGGNGSSSGSTSGSSSGGSTGGTCPVTFGQSSACQSCFADSCKGQCDACGADTECNTALTCLAACSTSSCEDGCLEGLSTNSLNLLGDMFSDPSGCVYASCRSDCFTPGRPGDPCLVAADCASGECASDGVHEGWCTISGCTSNEQCGVDTAGDLVWCVSTTGGGYECFPGCSTNADCEAFTCEQTNASPTCSEGYSVNGNDGYVCGC